MNRQLISESSRGHGEDKERLSHQPLPPRTATTSSHPSTKFPSTAKLSRTPYPRHLGSASTPNLRKGAFGSLDEEEIPPVPRIPARIPPPMLPTSPLISNLPRRQKATATVTSPSAPNFHHYQPSFHAAEPPAEKELPLPPSRPRLTFSPSISNLSQNISRQFSRRPTTVASPSAPNLHHHLNTATSPSTPNLGENRPKHSRFKKLRSGVKKLLHREPKAEKEEESRPLEISGPTDFRQLELDQNLKPVGVIATEYIPSNLSVPRFSGNDLHSSRYVSPTTSTPRATGAGFGLRVQ